MKKHLLAAVLILGLSLSGVSALAIGKDVISSGTLAVSDVTKDFPKEALYKMDMQEKVTRAYNELIRSFEQTEKAIMFPDEYGGAYNNGNGQLVVKLTHISSQTISRYKRAVGDPDILVFEKAEYAKNELEALCKTVLQWFLAEEIDWNQCYACDETLKAVIIVPETEYSRAQALLQSKMVPQKRMLPITLQASEKEKPAAYLEGGTSLRKARSPVSTLAFCGTYQGAPAIITCGHGGLSEGTKVYANNSASTNLVGKITVQQYKHKESGDFSIAKVTGSHTLTNLVQYASSGKAYPAKGYFRLPAKNDIVYQFGKNGYRNKCRVINTNTILNHGSKDGPFYISGMVYTAILESEASGVLKGDSGSPVYSLSSNQATALGVLSSGGSRSMTFSPLQWANGFSVKTN